MKQRPRSTPNHLILSWDKQKLIVRKFYRIRKANIQEVFRRISKRLHRRVQGNERKALLKGSTATNASELSHNRLMFSFIACIIRFLLKNCVSVQTLPLNKINPSFYGPFRERGFLFQSDHNFYVGIFYEIQIKQVFPG